MRKRWLFRPRWIARSIVPLALVLAVSCTRAPSPARLYAIRETAELEGWRVTVDSFSVLPPDAAFQPETGQVLCSVELTLENHSGQIRFMMPEKQMRLVSGGRTYALDQSAAVMSARLRQWMVPEGEMSLGIRTHGAASYQVPHGAEDVRWTFFTGLFPWSPSVTFVLGKLP